MYPGTELELFERAVHWKAYWAQLIHPFVRGSVLEVGAGTGNSTRALVRCRRDSWTCLERDPDLAARLNKLADSGAIPGSCDVAAGVIADLSNAIRYDTILYIDVLEHIRDDRRELEEAKRRLAPSGTLIILAPSHRWLFSRFDAAVGHERRYSRKALQEVMPAGMKQITLRYLDSAGLFASLANRLLLRQSMPTKSQIAFWDRVMVPCSRRLDPLSFYSIGKSILGIWQLKAR